MKIYSLTSKQNFPISLETAWEYFSNAEKLPEITPPWMHFELTNALPDTMYPGMIATYRIKPFKGISTTWVTEITQVSDKKYFIDEQRFGPYQFWHHQHHFKEIREGVEMEDIVHYALPLGILGRSVHKLSVQKKLKEIFQFRQQKLEELFGTI